MNKVAVKDILLETGRPKIVVPIVGTTHKEIMKEVKEIMKSPCDIMEWRADYYFGGIPNLEEELENIEAHRQMIRILDDIDYATDGKPLIFTIRGRSHGGMADISRENIFDLSDLAAQSQLVDFIDIEMFDDNDAYDEQQLVEIIDDIRGFDVKVILSLHEYNSILSNDQISNVITLMRELGADVSKIASMVKTPEDVANMLKVTGKLTTGNQDPVIVIAMGEAGFPTRVLGGRYGSCMTYAKGAKATAQGQIEAVELSKQLDKYYAK